MVINYLSRCTTTDQWIASVSVSDATYLLNRQEPSGTWYVDVVIRDNVPQVVRRKLICNPLVEELEAMINGAPAP